MVFFTQNKLIRIFNNDNRKNYCQLAKRVISVMYPECCTCLAPCNVVCVYVSQRIENNWRTGHHTLQRIHCRSETSKGVYCLQYDDLKIVSGLRDNTIKVSGGSL